MVGTLTLRLTVSGSDGSVTDVQFLADTLVPLPGEDPPSAVRAAVQHATRDFLSEAQFPVAAAGGSADTCITLPIIFD